MSENSGGHERSIHQFTIGKNMTNEEWKLAASHIGLYSPNLELDCDGYKLLIREERHRNKIVYSVYVNNRIKGEWLGNDCEERRRFLQPHKAKIIKNKKQETTLKKLYKRNEKEFINHYTYNSLIWTSFSRLKKHLIENNKSITWLNKPE